MLEGSALILSVSAVAASFVGKLVSAWLERKKTESVITIRAGGKSISVEATGSTEGDVRKLIEAYLATAKAEKRGEDGEHQ